MQTYKIDMNLDLSKFTKENFGGREGKDVVPKQIVYFIFTNAIRLTHRTAQLQLLRKCQVLIELIKKASEGDGVIEIDINELKFLKGCMDKAPWPNDQGNALVLRCYELLTESENRIIV